MEILCTVVTEFEHDCEKIPSSLSVNARIVIAIPVQRVWLDNLTMWANFSTVHRHIDIV